MSFSIAENAMPSYEAMIRAGALSFSLLVHGMLFITAGGSLSAPAPDSRSDAVTRLSFLAPTPVPEVVQEQPKKMVEPKKVIKPEEVVKRDKPEMAEAEQEEVPQEMEPQVMQQVAASSTDADQQLKEGVLQRDRERYLSSVMAHLEKHKWYPKAARRRGIEGEVSVSFMLLPDGSARDVVVEGAPSMLLAAAKEAVEKALPLPTPPANIHCPLACEFRMHFSLNAT
ncbi:TonB family protein [Pseudomonadota bacterium]